MSDVFLSYSRKDTDFVRQIFELLGARSREAWIDLNDIDYSVKWWDEICAGIDGADNFVLFLSPNSLTSLFCQREILYAREHQKRIIPFLISPVNEGELSQIWESDPEFKNYQQLVQENWKTVQAIQWIDFAKINQIDQAVDALLETVDTDPERTRLHTRLLLRLRGWESGGRNPSGLLRGDELIQYETWLVESNQAASPPHPTGEQEFYIQASRQAEDEAEAKRIRRERLVKRFRSASITLLLFFIAAVAAIFISITRERRTSALVAAGQTQIAIAGETLTPIPPALTAVAQTLVAGSSLIESQNLASEAISILQTEGGNAELAALFSIRALRNVYLESADEALVEAVYRLRVVPRVFNIGDHGVSGLAFAPDGKTFLVGISSMYEGGGELRDTESGDLIWSRELQEPVINSVAFSEDGNWIVAALGNNRAALWDAASGKTIREYDCENDQVREAIFSPDGKTILTLGDGEGQTVRAFDVETGEQRFAIPVKGGWMLKYFLDGERFQGGDKIYNASDGSLIYAPMFSKSPLDYSPRGQIYITGLSPTAEIWTANLERQLQTLSGHTGNIKKAVFSSSGSFVVTGSEDSSARVWDTQSGDPILILSGHSSTVNDIAISGDETRVLTGAGSEVRLWNLTGDSQQLVISTSAEIQTMALAPDGKTVLIGDAAGKARLWDLSSGKLIWTFPVSGPDIAAVAYAPDGTLLAIPVVDEMGGSVELYDPATGRLVKRLSVLADGFRNISYLAFSADGTMVFADFYGGVSKVWDVASGQLLREFSPDQQYRFAPHFRFSPAGNLVAVVAWDSAQLWWDLTTGERVEFPDNMWGPTVQFSPDGSLFAIAGMDEVKIWDLETKQMISTLGGHKDSIWSMAFSSDNSLLLTGSADKTAKLWDLATGQELRVFSGHRAAVTGVAFAPDGKTIVTASMDRTVRSWITDYHDLISFACTRVGRDLTQEERVRYDVTGQGASCPQFGTLTQPDYPTATPMLTPTPVQARTPIPTPTPGTP